MAEAENLRRIINPCLLHLQKMGLELKCPICLNLLRRPILLPCNHMLCRPCVPEIGSSCLVCKVPFLRQDLRSVPQMENIVSIYSSMEAAGPSGGTDISEKLSVEQMQNSQLVTLNPEASSVPSVQADKRVKTSHPIKSESETPERPAKYCKLGDGMKSHECVSQNCVHSAKVDAFVNEVNPAWSPSSTSMDMNCKMGEAHQRDVNQWAQTSAGSPPSFSNMKDSDDNHNDQGSEHASLFQTTLLITGNAHSKYLHIGSEHEEFHTSKQLNNMHSVHNILAVCNFENDVHVIYVERDTKLDAMIDVVCARWTTLTRNMVLLKYVLPGQGNNEVTLIQDVDISCMFDFHDRAGVTFINIKVLSRGNEVEGAIIERTTRRSEYDSNSVNVESSHSKRKLIEFWENEITEVGQEFNNANHFREALCNYAIAKNFNFKYIKNERRRITVQCQASGCGWRLHASRVGLCDRFQIKTFNKEHSCGGGLGTLSHPRASKRWVANIGMSKLSERPLYKPVEMMKDISIEYGVQVPYHQVWHGKELAMRKVHGDEAYSYDLLRWYCDVMVKSNPGSVFQIEVDPETKCFKRLFVSFHASIVGFNVGCRPLLFLDGTFIKSKYGGILLAATALNGDDKMFPLAFGIVDQETDENWSWFLTVLRCIVSNQRQLTFVSDRAKGLMELVPRIFPGSHHSYCLRHLIDNFKTEVCNKYSVAVRTRLVDLLKKAAHAFREQLFETHYLQLASESELARRFIDNSGKHHWAHAYFEGERYGKMYSNLVESYNSWILEARHLPITQLVDYICMQIMEMASRGKVDASKWETIMCPTVETLLTDNIKASGGLQCHTSVPLSVFEVHDNPSATVYLDSRKCDCRAWQILRIPCKHACAAIQFIGRSVYDYCSEYFTSNMYRKAYNLPIFPACWVDRPSIDTNNVQIKPPKTKKHPGRNKKK